MLGSQEGGRIGSALLEEAGGGGRGGVLQPRSDRPVGPDPDLNFPPRFGDAM